MNYYRFLQKKFLFFITFFCLLAFDVFSQSSVVVSSDRQQTSKEGQPVSTTPQSSANSITTNVSKTSENDRWDLNKYVWSHTHSKTSKNDKPVLDFDAIDNWESLSDDNISISPDGSYFAYGIERGSGHP